MKRVVEARSHKKAALDLLRQAQALHETVTAGKLTEEDVATSVVELIEQAIYEASAARDLMKSYVQNVKE